MRIVMFSINPLLPNTVMGGAPKHLQNIAIHMGLLGHHVTVLCTRSNENVSSFHWHEQVEVKPILHFKQPFPQPYEIPAYDIASTIQIVGEHLKNADRFYMHDGEFLFPYVYHDIPTVVSLRDNVYPETLIGGFLFQADKLILISDYSQQYYQHTVGRFFPEWSKRTEIIHNGLDWDKFKPTKPSTILEYLPAHITNRTIVLHPHRPEETKGVFQTIATIDILVKDYQLKDILVLAPQWHEAQASSELRDFYHRIEHEIQVRGLQDNFLFHGWIPQDLMPEYYSLGAVTLSLGSFPESFGNAVYESLGCGTPSIAARISTHRELLPETLLDKIDYGDVRSAAEIAARIIRNQERTSSETLNYLHENYGIKRQLEHYAKVIIDAQHASSMQYSHQKINEGTRFILAPWCYRSQSRGIYHDFYADYRDLKQFIPLFEAFSAGFNLRDAQDKSISQHEVMDLYDKGYLVPVSSCL